MVTSREIRLKSRPAGMPVADNFEVATVSVPDPAAGEVQVRNLWMTVDPYMRNRMTDQAPNAPPRDDRISEIAASNATMFGWRPPFELGEVLQGGAIGKVVASNDQSLRPGALVSSWLGWREVFNTPADTLEKLETFGLPLETLLGVAGMPGLTAWVGLTKIAALKPGDVVFVSAASGAVGSVACQIAKIKGHTVIGSAGGARKCAFLQDIGVDRVIDYKATNNFTEALLQVAPNGIDVYFDNVGGEHLEAALAAANPFARFALCGMISQYNTAELPPGPRNIMFAVGKSIRLEGFNISPRLDLMPEFRKQMSAWIHEGKVMWKETVAHGVENAPLAFIKLFKGENFGKIADQQLAPNDCHGSSCCVHKNIVDSDLLSSKRHTTRRGRTVEPRNIRVHYLSVGDDPAFVPRRATVRRGWSLETKRCFPRREAHRRRGEQRYLNSRYTISFLRR